MDTSTLALLVGLMILSGGGYLAWPNRWNIVTHLSLAFGVVAYAIPITMLHVGRSYDASTVHSLGMIVFVGSLAYLAGILIGRIFADRHTAGIALRIRRATGCDGEELTATGSEPPFQANEPHLSQAAAATKTGPDEQARSEKHILQALSFGLVLMVFAVAVMGFVPLLADDPSSARFFRGEYKAAYDRVSIPYRLSFVIIPSLFSFAVYFALSHASKKRPIWRIVCLASLIMLVLTLSRSSIGEGLLLLAVIWLVSKRHSIFALLLSVGFYIGGGLFFALLSLLGIGSFAGTQAAPSDTLWTTIGSTVPDVTDALTFMERWQAAGTPHTHGLTIIGGLVPGNFKWNPSVWSITLGNPNVDITSLNTGGLRLPSPLWGAINFGTVGIVLIPLISGILVGYWLTSMSKAYDNISVFGALSLTWASSILVRSLGASFSTIGYLDVVEVILMLFIFRPEKARDTPSAKDAGLITDYNRYRL